MFIHEAVRTAIENRGVMTRPNLLGAVIVPTNTRDCCFVAAAMNIKPTPRWNPSADDLSADDWIVTREAQVRMTDTSALEESEKRHKSISVEVDCSSIDSAIEKANRLVELLREASSIIDSLSLGGRSET